MKDFLKVANEFIVNWMASGTKFFDLKYLCAFVYIDDSKAPT